MNDMHDLDQKRDELNRAELARRISAVLPNDGISDPIPGLRLARASAPTDRVFGVSKPSLCVIAQGAKELNVGDNLYRYDPEHFLLATVELPLTGRISEATPDFPYLSLRIELEPSLVGSVMIEAGISAPQGGQADSKAMVVSRLGSDILETVLRLIRLLDADRDAAVLLPLVKRELVFRLLLNEQGSRLRNLPRLGGHTDRIAKAVDQLNRHYDQALSVERIAKDLGMSVSGFHDHFKRVTDMSPLQFQKQLRLQEARRLMLGESLYASTAGHRVGYDDPSHFSRDYKRHFGDSPMRDIERLRSMALGD
jgi:AraC-like DNA-binding protein